MIYDSEAYNPFQSPMKYLIALQESEEGLGVWVPELPGCWSQGVTAVFNQGREEVEG